ncbi:Voltage-dependent calcium channel beta subunit-associated regulatory protein [Collichthys lucidus]|uniref:Voltage-dependent calcium channel beta subunit-associated regulatory protein n=1 Tax=Collichthys lucidus TaxID=240159 RepID=A0A4U5UYC6_COLLU|nr:Voltage-dependent calcium channel beta subunit-associated regulatory protein [Collichthys lucidus]
MLGSLCLKRTNLCSVGEKQQPMHLLFLRLHCCFSAYMRHSHFGRSEPTPPVQSNKCVVISFRSSFGSVCKKFWAESTRRRDVGQPRSAGFRRREEDAADADAEAEAAAAERRRLQRVAVGSLTLTWTMSNDLPVLTSLTENSTDVPVSAGQVENYVLLLVLLSVFAGGTLVLLSLLLLFCHRCCMGGRRYSRASDDLEKTNTTYAEDSQPTQGQDLCVFKSSSVHVFSSTVSNNAIISLPRFALVLTQRSPFIWMNQTALSASSCHDGESERFVSTMSTGRRVSFNESALYEQEKTTQDKARRYTLTEGDFHHLKKARLTHLHLPPAPCDLKILTIMECDSTESSTLNISETTAPKLPLTIYQMEAVGDRGEAESKRGTRGELTQAPGQTSVLHFFSKLRRHASLEGAGPYFRRWKFDSSHRAASLDAKGSPKRKPFQRQRAASETTDHAEDDSPLRDELIESFPQTPTGLQSALCRVSPHTHVLSLPQQQPMEAGVEKETKFGAVKRTEAVGVELQSVEEDDLFGPQEEAPMQERSEDILRKTKDTKTDSGVRKMSEAEIDDRDEVVLGAEARGRADSGSSLSFMIRQESSEAPPSLYRDIWSLRASLEQYASSDQSSTDRESIRSDADSVSSVGGAGARSGLDSCLSQDLDDEPEGEGEGEMVEGGIRGASGGDGEMGSGAGGESEAGNRKLLQMDSGYASIEAPSRAPEEMRLFGTPGAPRGKTASERRLFFTSSGRKGSVCESIETRLFEEEMEDEMTDGKETEEKLKERSQTGSQSLTLKEPYQLPKNPYPQKPSESQSQLMSPLLKANPTILYIDEKTDALFNEFLRHDPRFDQQDSPLRSRHRSRVHLRKQWQRHKQYSDPGSGTGGRYSPSLERQRFIPLRRGDSAGYPLDTRYHSTLSRIASAADEEASEVAACEEAATESTENEDPKDATEDTANTTSVGTDATKSRAELTSEDDDRQESTTNHSLTTVTTQKSSMDPRVDNRNNNSSQAILSEISLQAESSLTDKLVVSVEERLYGSLRSAEKLSQGGTEHVLTMSHTASPGFSPM